LQEAHLDYAFEALLVVCSEVRFEAKMAASEEDQKAETTLQEDLSLVEEV
jgi:hypothetical protein